MQIKPELCKGNEHELQIKVSLSVKQQLCINYY